MEHFMSLNEVRQAVQVLACVGSLSLPCMVLAISSFYKDAKRSTSSKRLMYVASRWPYC
jgi:hypothetical protein